MMVRARLVCVAPSVPVTVLFAFPVPRTTETDRLVSRRATVVVAVASALAAAAVPARELRTC